MLKTICDRCGKNITDELKGETFTLNYFSHNRPSEKWDLCPECSNELQLFVKGTPWR